jgi:hypothetical protein
VCFVATAVETNSQTAWLNALRQEIDTREKKPYSEGMERFMSRYSIKEWLVLDAVLFFYCIWMTCAETSKSMAWTFMFAVAQGLGIQMGLPPSTLKDVVPWCDTILKSYSVSVQRAFQATYPLLPIQTIPTPQEQLEHVQERFVSQNSIF